MGLWLRKRFKYFSLGKSYLFLIRFFRDFRFDEIVELQSGVSRVQNFFILLEYVQNFMNALCESFLGSRNKKCYQ